MACILQCRHSLGVLQNYLRKDFSHFENFLILFFACDLLQW